MRRRPGFWRAVFFAYFNQRKFKTKQTLSFSTLYILIVQTRRGFRRPAFRAHPQGLIITGSDQMRKIKLRFRSPHLVSCLIVSHRRILRRLISSQPYSRSVLLWISDLRRVFSPRSSPHPSVIRSL